MPRPSAPTVVVAVTVLASVIGCDRSEPPATETSYTNPPNTGATCDDPSGDLSRTASERGGNLTEPAGVDLTHAEAKVGASSLKVSFTTVGTVGSAPNSEFRVGLGVAGQLDSFELVATPPNPGPGPWELRLVTFRTDAKGGVTEAPRTLLPVPVTVSGNTLSYEVPLSSLPALSSYVWQFGASSSVDPNGDDTVIDDCARL